MEKKLVLAHELDIAWIISLWLAIHGGDPARDVIKIDAQTQQLALSLTEHLTKKFNVAQSENEAQIHSGLGSIGIQVVHEQAKAQSALPPAGTVICTEVPSGHMYCFKVPKVKAPPPGNGPSR